MSKTRKDIPEMIKVTPKFQTAYQKAIGQLLEQSDKDYRNLQLAMKAKQAPKTPVKPNMTYAEALKNFFENGVMTLLKK